MGDYINQIKITENDYSQLLNIVLSDDGSGNVYNKLMQNFRNATPIQKVKMYISVVKQRSQYWEFDSVDKGQNPDKSDRFVDSIENTLPKEIRNSFDENEIVNYIKSHTDPLTGEKQGITFRTLATLMMRLHTIDKVAEANNNVENRPSYKPGFLTGKTIKNQGKNVPEVVDNISEDQAKNGRIELDVHMYKRQSSGNGCWSCGIQVLLNSRGSEVTQEEIRSYRPEDANKRINEYYRDNDNLDNNTSKKPQKRHYGADKQFNTDDTQNVVDRGDTVLAFAPDTMMRTLDIYGYNEAEKVLNKKIDRKKYLDDSVKLFKKTIREVLVKDRSPLTISNGSHYITIVGIDGDNILVKNSLNYDKTPNNKIIDHADETYPVPIKEYVDGILKGGTGYNGARAFRLQLSWVTDIALSKKDFKTFYNLPSNVVKLNDQHKLIMPPKEIRNVNEKGETEYNGFRVSLFAGREEPNSVTSSRSAEELLVDGVVKREQAYFPKKINYERLKSKAEARSDKEDDEMKARTETLLGHEINPQVEFVPDYKQKQNVDNSSKDLDSIVKNPFSKDDTFKPDNISKALDDDTTIIDSKKESIKEDMLDSMNQKFADRLPNIELKFNEVSASIGKKRQIKNTNVFANVNNYNAAHDKDKKEYIWNKEGAVIAHRLDVAFNLFEDIMIYLYEHQLLNENSNLYLKRMYDTYLRYKNLKAELYSPENKITPEEGANLSGWDGKAVVLGNGEKITHYFKNKRQVYDAALLLESMHDFFNYTRDFSVDKNNSNGFRSALSESADLLRYLTDIKKGNLLKLDAENDDVHKLLTSQTFLPPVNSEVLFYDDKNINGPERELIIKNNNVKSHMISFLGSYQLRLNNDVKEAIRTFNINDVNAKKNQINDKLKNYAIKYENMHNIDPKFRVDQIVINPDADQNLNPNPNPVQNNGNGEELNEERHEEEQHNEDGLIKIIDPDKNVKGFTWKTFHEKLTSLGWPNAENDNLIRGLYNLSNDKEEVFSFWIELITGDKKYGDGEGKEGIENYTTPIYNAVRDSILSKGQELEQPLDLNLKETIDFFIQYGIKNCNEKNPPFNNYKPTEAKKDEEENKEHNKEGENKEDNNKEDNNKEDNTKEDNKDINTTKGTPDGYEKWENPDLALYFKDNTKSQFTVALSNIKINEPDTEKAIAFLLDMYLMGEKNLSRAEIDSLSDEKKSEFGLGFIEALSNNVLGKNEAENLDGMQWIGNIASKALAKMSDGVMIPAKDSFNKLSIKNFINTDFYRLAMFAKNLAVVSENWKNSFSYIKGFGGADKFAQGMNMVDAMQAFGLMFDRIENKTITTNEKVYLKYITQNNALQGIHGQNVNIFANPQNYGLGKRIKAIYGIEGDTPNQLPEKYHEFDSLQPNELYTLLSNSPDSLNQAGKKSVLEKAQGLLVNNEQFNKNILDYHTKEILKANKLVQENNNSIVFDLEVMKPENIANPNNLQNLSQEALDKAAEAFDTIFGPIIAVEAPFVNGLNGQRLDKNKSFDIVSNIRIKNGDKYNWINIPGIENPKSLYHTEQEHKIMKAFVLQHMMNPGSFVYKRFDGNSLDIGKNAIAWKRIPKKPEAQLKESKSFDFSGEKKEFKTYFESKGYSGAEDKNSESINKDFNKIKEELIAMRGLTSICTDLAGKIRFRVQNSGKMIKQGNALADKLEIVAALNENSTPYEFASALANLDTEMGDFIEGAQKYYEKSDTLKSIKSDLKKLRPKINNIIGKINVSDDSFTYKQILDECYSYVSGNIDKENKKKSAIQAYNYKRNKGVMVENLRGFYDTLLTCGPNREDNSKEFKLMFNTLQEIVGQDNELTPFQFDKALQKLYGVTSAYSQKINELGGGNKHFFGKKGAVRKNVADSILYTLKPMLNKKYNSYFSPLEITDNQIRHLYPELLSDISTLSNSNGPRTTVKGDTKKGNTQKEDTKKGNTLKGKKKNNNVL